MAFDKQNDVASFSRTDLANVPDPDTALAAEGLELMHVFVRLPSADDRFKVIALAKQLLRNAEN